ncbi:MAG: hypothetical protein J6P71_06120, partial [Oscillospiraceae bacterium]|nr:hypothetical protein [Oscillospiraceae bacterium]
QGVRLMRVADGVRVVSVARTTREAAEDEAGDEAPPAESANYKMKDPPESGRVLSLNRLPCVRGAGGSKAV